ncbi:MAG: hypothetical protein GTO67_08120, partial [Gammaproteobacteria bacterium]|nr:hypothetical protein [Gammaproteobacteria bacterium]NIM73009.1 hypothetical protein [Gammaproteobacteria bacterium]NIN38625.1 hypothetical protein [Gammaproteobacteria bacterium]NIO24761.1 hypothetical protein [Gammaproteobacteria bacterium]NIO65364.1 hypothetical protein [Gammaproteobacteria bacterium]
MRTLLLTLMICIGMPSAVQAATDPDGGEVRVPLDTYRRLVEQASQVPKPAPAAFAIGVSHVNVTVIDDEKHTTARVEATIDIETFENQWTLVPILPPGAALAGA